MELCRSSYPPGSHMAIAALMKVMPLRAAFVAVQLVALLLLTIGGFRFARLWVTARPAGYAAISLVLASSISETVHLFGQLPTTLSLGIFLNGLPYVYRWIAGGGWANFVAAVIFGAATTAGHFSARWDGRDARGRRAAAGVYFVQWRDSRGSASGKLVLVEQASALTEEDIVRNMVGRDNVCYIHVTLVPFIGPSGEQNAATLGGWNLAVSNYSQDQEAAMTDRDH